MAKYKQYEELADDLRNECLNGMCRKLDDGCNPQSELCGIARGIKYGIYPKTAIKAPQSYLGQKLRTQITYGVGCKEQPLWKNGEGMANFAIQVAAYTEDWMKYEKWGLT